MSVLLVTGASSGIGAAVALAFAEAGWDVMASGRDEGRLDELAEAAENVVTWAGALESSDDCDELVADTLDEFGQIDCLVNSAGVLFRGETEAMGAHRSAFLAPRPNSLMQASTKSPGELWNDFEPS